MHEPLIRQRCADDQLKDLGGKSSQRGEQTSLRSPVFDELGADVAKIGYAIHDDGDLLVDRRDGDVDRGKVVHELQCGMPGDPYVDE